MNRWMAYAILAGAAYGLSAVPLKYAASRHLRVPPGLILFSSSIGAMTGALAYLTISGNPMSFSINKSAILLSLLSGLIGVAGSLAVIKALAHSLSNVSNVMALVNTNVLFTVLFGVVILREFPTGTEAIRV